MAELAENEPLYGFFLINKKLLSLKILGYYVWHQERKEWKFSFSQLRGSPPCCDLILLHPFQPKLCPVGQFVWPKCYFQPILAPLGHNLCHSGSSKCPKLVCLVILSAISTFFP